MSLQIQLIGWILLLSTVINISLAIYLWKKRNILIARYLFYLLLAIAIWTFSAIFETIVTTAELKLLWTQISSIGMISLPVIYFLFAMAYGQRFRFLNKKSIISISFLPALSFIAIWTNSFHHLYYTRIVVDSLTNIATYHHGPGFLINTIYAYGLLLLGISVFARSLLQHKSLFRPQIILMLSGAILPFAGNVFYIFGKSPIPGLEWTPIFFTFSGLFITWGIFKYNLLDLIPTARHRLIDSMPSGIMVVDKHHYVVDVNPGMERIIGLSAGQMLGRSLASLQGQLAGLCTYLIQEQPLRREIQLTKNGNSVYYHLEITPLTDVKNEFQGTLALLTDITEKKLLAGKLKDTEKLYQIITETAQDGIVTINNDSIVISVNKAACNIFGYTSSELLGQSLTLLMPKESIDKHNQSINRFVETGIRNIDWRTQEVIGKHKNGQNVYLGVSFSHFNMDGDHFFTGILKDITLKKEAERDALKLHELNESIVNSSPLGILTIGRDGQVTSANPAFLGMVGSPGIDKTTGLKIDMESIQNVGIYDILRKGVEQGEAFYINRLKYTSKWGKDLFLNVRGVPLMLDGSRNLGMVAIVENITESVKLQEDYNLLSEVVTTSPVRIVITNKNGVIEYVNQAFENVTGYLKHEVIGKSPKILKSGVHSKEFYKDMWDTIILGKAWTNRILNRKKNGDLFWEESTISSIRNEQQEIVHFVQVATDITAQKHIEDDLNVSRDMLKALSDATFESIFLSEQGKCLGQNNTAERMFGYTSNEAIGKMGVEWIVEKDRDIVIHNMMSGYEKPYEVSALRKDGSTFPCEIQGRMVDFHGRKVRVTALRNITRRNEAFEKIIEQSESLRILSNELVNAHDTERRTLARELHDEFGQTLTATLLNIEQIMDSLDTQNIPDVQRALTESHDMINHMNDQMHELTLRLHPMMLDELGLIPTMSWYLKQYSERTSIKIKQDIQKLDKRYPEKIENVLFRILQEALNNAAKYSNATEINVELKKEENTVILTIQDNGIGFNPDEIYNRPKSHQQMGLRGMKERVTYLEGSFTLSSKPNKGTKIITILPLSEKS